MESFKIITNGGVKKRMIIKNSKQPFILITAILVLIISGIYFFSAYSQMQESNDVASQIQTILFTTAGITCLPLGIWMIKNKLHNLTPYVIAILISISLIGLYAASRTISLPIVGIQEDVGVIDILSKAIQTTIVVMSLLILNWRKKSIESLN